MLNLGVDDLACLLASLTAVGICGHHQGRWDTTRSSASSPRSTTQKATRSSCGSRPPRRRSHATSHGGPQEGPDPTRATLPPGPGLDLPTRTDARAARRSSHADRSDRDGAGGANSASGPRRRGPRRNEPTGGPAPCRPFRCGSCWRPASTSATRRAAGTQDEPVHLRGAQRDPHHRPGPDRPAARRRPGVRPRDRRPGRPGPLRRHQEAGPGAGRPGGGPRRPAVRQQALAWRHAHQLRDHQEAHRRCSSSSRHASRTATSSASPRRKRRC